MARILAIDYGERICGLAWTDPLRLFAVQLPACVTADVFARLDGLRPDVDELVVGLPRRLDLRPTHATEGAQTFGRQAGARFPDVKITFWDERFTSRMAQQTLLASGVNRTRRADKMLLNSLSAVILLQNYLDSLS